MKREEFIGGMELASDRLTVDEFCEELMISRDTFYDWCKKGRAPKCAKLPNGSLLIRRTEFDKFMAKAEANA